MSTRFVLRAAATMAAVAGFIILTTSRALAYVDPGLGQGSGAAPPPAPPTPVPFEVFGMAWQGALALSVALIAVVGLAYSVQHRRHAAGAPA